METQQIRAWPLQWPDGWPKAPHRTRAAFGKKVSGAMGVSFASLSIGEGCGRVLRELTAMRIAEDDIVISTNIKVRLDGMPQSKAGNATDPGVAVYWMRKGKRQCIAIDRYDRVADNLAAIAATLDAMRAIDRHGGAQILDRAFTGFVALAAPEQWFQVLGVSVSASVEQIDSAYRSLAQKHHPDRNGGNDYEMKRINAARDEGLRHR